MADETGSTDAHSIPRSSEVGTVIAISLLLGAVASLPTLTGMMEGKVPVVRGAMWFLVTTLIAMVGVWTITYLVHVFTDPYPDDVANDEVETIDAKPSLVVDDLADHGAEPTDARATALTAQPALTER